MEKKIKALLSKPIYIELLGVLFIVFKLSLWPTDRDWLVIVLYFLGFLGINFLLIRLMSVFVKVQQIRVLLFICWFTFFFHVDIIRFIQNLMNSSHSIKYRYIWILAILIGLVFSYTSFKFKRFNKTFNQFVNTFLLIGTSIILLHGFNRYYETNSILRKTYKESTYLTDTSRKKTDIVWILMDEYASPNVLREKLNFSNPFDTFLKNNQFYVFDNFESKTDQTISSLNSVFNFKKLDKPVGFGYGLYTLKNSVLPKVLEDCGYSFTNISFFNIGKEQKIQVLNYYDQSQVYRLINGTLIEAATMYLPIKFGGSYKFEIDSINSYNEKVFSKLQGELSVNPIEKQNRFIYSHFLIPHSPFYEIVNGEKKHVDAKDSTSQKSAYLNYLLYGNSLLEKLITENISLKDKIIVITGDHGVRFDFWGKGKHRTSTYAAVYFPKDIKLEDSSYQSLQYISDLPAFILNHAVHTGP